MAIFAGVYMFVLGGMTATFSVIYAFLPEHFNVTITQLALGGSVGVFSSMILGFFAAKVIGILKPRRCMILGAVMIIIYSLVSAYVRNFFGVLIPFLCTGVILAFAHQSVIAALMSNWFVEKRASIISTCVSANMFGIFLYQLVAGQLVEKLSVSKVYLIFGCVSSVILLFCALGVRNTPQDIGEKALGAGNAETPAPSDEAEGAVKAPEKVSVKELYTNPTFWLMILATIFVGTSVSMVGTYMTIYFPSVGGMEYSTAALLVSILGLVSGFCTMVSGKVMEKLGIRWFILILMGGAILCSFMTAFYSRYQGIVLVVLIVITYGMGFSASYITNILSAPLFGERLAIEANTKLLAVLMGGNAVLTPVFASMFETLGYPTTYFIRAVINVGVLVIYLIAMASAKRRGVEV